MTMPVALQMYSVRDKTEKDMLGTLEKVAEIGYKGVEFAGFMDVPAKSMKARLESLGLKPVGSHTSMKLLKENLDEAIAYNLEIGNQYIICPFNSYESREDYLRTAAFLEETGKKCRAAGLRLGYHNHDFEFKRYDGEYGFDILFGKTTPENLVAELDTGWAFNAGADPVEYLGRYKGRCPLIHVKDFLTRGERTFAEIGMGIIDIGAIIKAAAAAGTEWAIVEQDATSLPTLESVEISFNNLKKIL